MHNALVISRIPGWAAGSGLSDALSWLSLAVCESVGFDDVPKDPLAYAVAIVRLAPGDPPPTAAQWRDAGLSDAIQLVVGSASDNTAYIGRVLPEPITEGVIATALANSGYLLPLPGECPAIGQHISGLVEGDTAIIAQLVASLIDTTSADLLCFKQACAAQHWQEVRARAHRIKGTAHMAGTASLARLSQRIEVLAEQQQADTLRALHAIYVPAVERVLAVLAALK
ncbi:MULTISPECIES: Hpt domain-containing protein [Bordetella]|uniref:Hpt domain-containing protein n=2 Tax=Bordetella TaxID=517 RepID=A0A261VG60_9BORD|nr:MULTISPECIES: Hpt domain-containing protein [Bordetella]MDM9560295.1 Hpt domain-containing protein [Bordetella petrii]OZI72761.1 Hpt domain-containing protein [Bordetella genomosp. 2]